MGSKIPEQEDGWSGAFTIPGEAEFGMRLQCSVDGEQYTEIRYRSSDCILQAQVDRNRSGIGDDGISEATLEPWGTDGFGSICS